MLVTILLLIQLPFIVIIGTFFLFVLWEYYVVDGKPVRNLKREIYSLEKYIQKLEKELSISKNETVRARKVAKLNHERWCFVDKKLFKLLYPNEPEFSENLD
jgi:hypothetical protein